MLTWVQPVKLHATNIQSFQVADSSKWIWFDYYFLHTSPTSDTTTKAKGDAKDFWVNMPNLIAHLKKVAEQKPQATYYNVDMLKYQASSVSMSYNEIHSWILWWMIKWTIQILWHYFRFQKSSVVNWMIKLRLHIVRVQVSAEGLQSVPLNLAVSWRCEPTSTDLRIDYKYNGEAMTTPMALNNVQFLIPVDGGVSKLQAVLPPAAWYSWQPQCRTRLLVLWHLLSALPTLIGPQKLLMNVFCNLSLQECRATKNPLEDSRHLAEVWKWRCVPGHLYLLLGLWLIQFALCQNSES